MAFACGRIDRRDLHGRSQRYGGGEKDRLCPRRASPQPLNGSFEVREKGIFCRRGMAGAGKPGKGRPMGRPRALLASDLGLAGPNNPTRTLKPLALRPYRSVGGKDYLRQQKAKATGSFRLFAKGYMTQMEQYSNHLELRVGELEKQLADKAAAAVAPGVDVAKYSMNVMIEVENPPVNQLDLRNYSGTFFTAVCAALG